MANNCYYDMKVVGEPKAVQEFIRCMRYEEEYKEDGLGRIFDCEVIDGSNFENSTKINGWAVVAGDCAWSVKCSMMKEYIARRNLESETARLGLCVEVFSEELGFEFQEHIIVDKGLVTLDDSVDVEEYCLDDLDEEEIQELVEDFGITREQLFEEAEEGYYKHGGYANFGEFTI